MKGGQKTAFFFSSSEKILTYLSEVFQENLNLSVID